MKSLLVSKYSIKHADRCMQALGYSTNTKLGACRLEECAAVSVLNGLVPFVLRTKSRMMSKHLRVCPSHMM